MQVWNSHLSSKGRLGLQVPPTGSKLRPLALMRSEQDLKGHLPARQASSWSNKAFKVPVPSDTELPARGQGHTQNTRSHACAGSHIHSSPAKRKDWGGGKRWSGEAVLSIGNELSGTQWLWAGPPSLLSLRSAAHHSGWKPGQQPALSHLSYPPRV